jgi:uncharacterized protein (TIGR03437 family)
MFAKPFFLSCAVLLFLIPAGQAQTNLPVISAGGVVNSAEYAARFAPGGMTSIFGSNLAPQTVQASGPVLPTSLSGVSVEISPAGAGVLQAPLYFVSPGLINFQLPFGLAAGPAQVRVRTPQGVSAPANISISPAAPALFTADASGAGDPLAVHAATYALVRASNPAAPGEYLVVLATGLGEVTPATPAGRPGGDNGQWGPLNWTTVKPSVTLGGRQVPVAFWGLMPGYAGAYQLNVQVPPDMAPGYYPLVVRMGEAQSQSELPIAVGRPGEVLGSTTISSAGGTVSGGGVTVAVPPGAVAESVPVSIVRAADPPAAAPGRISDVFVVRGLPAERAQPVTVTLPLTQAAGAGTETLVAMNSGPGLQGTGVEFLDAVIEGNQVRVTLPASDVPPLAAAERAASGSLPERFAQASGPEVSFYVMSFYLRENSAGGHFMIFYPRGDTALASKIPAVGQTLEEAYGKIASLGLDWSRRKRWPMRVVIRPLTGADADKWGVAEPSVLGKDYWSVTLNANKLSATGLDNAFRATVGHELFHVMQDLYDPRSAYRVAKFSTPWLWFWDAASTWFESYMLGDDSYIPATVIENNYTFLTRHGLEYLAGDQKDVQAHGYGASMFLQHLVKTSSATRIGDTVKRAANRAPGILARSVEAPVEALNAATGFGLGAKWVDFVEKYAQGQIYRTEFPHMSLISGQRKGLYVFETDANTGTVFEWTSSNLSAAVFQLRFTQAWPSNTALTLSFEAGGDYVKAFLYRFSSKGVTPAGTFTSSITIANAESFQKDGEQLIIVVADGSGGGAYQGSNFTRLKVQKGVDLLSILRGFSRISHKIYGNQTCTYGSGGTFTGTLFAKSPVLWSGNAFSLEAEDRDLVPANSPFPPPRVSIRGTVSRDGLRIEQMTFERVERYEYRSKDSHNREYLNYRDHRESWTLSDAVLQDPDRVTPNRAGVIFSGGTVSGYSYITRSWDGFAANFRPELIEVSSCTMAVTRTDTSFSRPAQ